MGKQLLYTILPAKYDLLLFGNSITDYIFALAILILFLAVFKIFQLIILRRLKKLAEKTKTDVDDILIEATQSLKPPFYYLISLYFVLPFLTIKASALEIIKGILLVLIIYQVIKAILIVVDYIFEKLSQGKKADGGVQTAYSYLGTFAKIAIWTFGLLLILSNLGVNVNSLLAGLGIGGIAFAFAIKGILADLFASFVIFFDKPFVLGDNIQIGDTRGKVLKIGIKTTRILSPQGEEIVISNQELTSAQLHNHQTLEERKGAFSFGVVYETPTEKLKQISEWVKEIISGMDKTRFGRAHFNRFDESALNFDVIYFMETNDYGKYMDTQQAINLQILEKFAEQGIEMAYPTRVVYNK
ncbi:MAG: mechanosensitive ion channel family protein [Patescibacteria group bacterium]